MKARPAMPADAPEMLRLAAMMFASMGSDLSDDTWVANGIRDVQNRLGSDMAGFVVDHPDEAGRLIASCAGTMTRRLPNPRYPEPLVGYIQWVCTDPEYRRLGLAGLVMDDLLNWYAERGVRNVELHSTPMAESLYLSMGFDDSGGRALRRRT